MVRTAIRTGWLAVMLALAGPVAAQPPQRVVSMNLCTDQLAMMLAGPGQLISVSHLGHDPAVSPMAAQACGSSVPTFGSCLPWPTGSSS